MNQMEERAHSACRAIETSTSSLSSASFTPPSERKPTVVVAATLAAGALTLSVGLLASWGDGPVDIDTVDASQQAISTTGSAEERSVTTDGANTEGLSGSDAIVPEDDSVDPSSKASGGSPTVGSDIASTSTSSPTSTSAPTSTSTATTDGGNSVENTPASINDAGSTPIDQDAVLVLEAPLVAAEALVVPEVVRNASSSDIYGRAGVENPFVDGDLVVDRWWNDPGTIPVRISEELTVAGTAVQWEPTKGYRPGGLSWREDDGTNVRVSSYLLDREAITAAATSLLQDGQLDPGDLDLLASGVRSELAWSNLPPGSTLYRYRDIVPSTPGIPAPSIVPGTNISQITIETGGGADERSEALAETRLELGGADPAIVDPPEPVQLLSPGGIEVTVVQTSNIMSRLRYDSEFGPVTMTLFGNGATERPVPEAVLALVDSLGRATEQDVEDMTERGMEELGTTG